MKGKTKTTLTVIIAILIFAVAVVGTVTFLKDDGEASAAEVTPNVLPVTGSDDEPTNSNGEENPEENLTGEENPEEQPNGANNEEANGNAQGTTGTTGNQETNAAEPEATTIWQERLTSTTLNWTNISLNSTIGRTGINYTDLGYTIKYYQVVNEEETNLINTETDKAEYKSTVTVTEEQLEENCPTGYKLDENSDLSVEITENVDKNIIEVYYIKDENQTKNITYTVKHHVDGVHQANDDVVTTTEVWVNDTTVPVTYTVNENKYTGYKYDHDDLEETATDGKVFNVYYVKDENQTKTLSYRVEYYKDGNKVDEDCYSVPQNVWVNAPDTLTVKPVDTSDTKYTGYRFEHTEPETIPATIENGGVIKVYYVKQTYAYRVEYYYEDLSGNYIADENVPPVTGTAKYQDVITTFEPKDQNGAYVLSHVDPAKSATENKVANLVITENVEANVLNVYYNRNTFNYKVEYYKESVNGTKLGETEVKEQKIGTVMTAELVSADFGTDWLNAKKPTVGYQDGEVAEYITIQANDNNVIKVVYKPRTDIKYSVEYYFNGEHDASKDEKNKSTTYGAKIKTVTDHSNNGEWTLDTSKSTALPFTIGAAGNVIKVYYVKPVITVNKVSTPSVKRENGVVEPGETIKYTITATNNGYKDGTVNIADIIPEGTTLKGTISATGYNTVTVEQLNAGLDLTVPAKDATGKAGTAKVEFTVTVTAKPGDNTVNVPTVDGKEDEGNKVTNPVEKTVSVKAKSQTIKNSNIVIVIDTSLSMSYVKCPYAKYNWWNKEWSHEGCSNTDHRVLSSSDGYYLYHKDETMINAAKQVTNEFIDKINLSNDANNIKSTVTVIQFDGNTERVGTAKLATQKDSLKNRVSAMTTAPSTNMSTALSEAKKVFSDSNLNLPSGNNNIVIFLSDGEPTDDVKKVSPAATELKDVATVYTVGFGAEADTNTLQNTIASSTNKYFAAADGNYSSLYNAFQQATDDMSNFENEQTTNGKIALTGIYADANHAIKITVNGTALADITSLPTDASGKVIKDTDGNYYLDLSKFEATDNVTIEYYAK